MRLNSQTKEVVADAAEALGRRNETSAVEPLILVVRSFELNLPVQCHSPWPRLGDKRAVEPLAKALARQRHLPEIAVALAILDAPAAGEKTMDAIRMLCSSRGARSNASILLISQLFGGKDDEFLVSSLDQQPSTCGIAARLIVGQGTPAAKEPAGEADVGSHRTAGPRRSSPTWPVPTMSQIAGGVGPMPCPTAADRPGRSNGSRACRESE